MNQRHELIKQTAEVPEGGSEDETARAVKDLFRPSIDPMKKYKSMSQEDIDELNRMHEENLKILKDMK